METFNDKKFVCECGKEFVKAQSFNAHKSSCKEHYLAKYGNLDYWNELQNNKRQKLNAFYTEKAKKDSEAKLLVWISEKHACERCGKIMTEKYGSGRFCCQTCANSHANSGPICTCSCDFCGQKFTSQKQLDRHIPYCDGNPERRPKVIPHKYKLDPATDLYRMGKEGQLVNTIEDILQYKEQQLVCEICGRTVEESVKWQHKNSLKSLCVDHDHATMQFRGMLCQICNRQLGWFEKNQEAIMNYLNKPYPLEDKSDLADKDMAE